MLIKCTYLISLDAKRVKLDDLWNNFITRLSQLLSLLPAVNTTTNRILVSNPLTTNIINITSLWLQT